MISGDSLLWIVFSLLVLVLLALDLGVFHRKSHDIGVKEAMIWSLIWIAVALVFNLVVYLWHGQETALQIAQIITLQSGSN